MSRLPQFPVPPLDGPGSKEYPLRKEVIQPQVLLRLPCYDLVPIASLTVGASLPKVGSATSGATSSRGLTGGVYKAQEHIHRGMLIRDYYRFRLHAGELQPAIRTRDDFLGFAPPCGLASLCITHCRTFAALAVRAMMT